MYAIGTHCKNETVASVETRLYRIKGDKAMRHLHYYRQRGSATGSKELMKKVPARQSIFGTAGGTFSTWLVQRSILTLGLRMKKLMTLLQILNRL